MSDNTRVLMQGNEAMARGLVEQGCMVAASYPGTPASEILSAVGVWQQAEQVTMHVEWSVNEKVAFEVAYAAAQSGLRAATAMKQVGLNVASDPLMSAAYLGVTGGFIVISADDPGPHSSQTEQDTRLMAMVAKVPVLDPSSPAEAREFVELAYTLSEQFELPVILRPTTRVCHACQDIAPIPPIHQSRTASFNKNPQRWAATPKFRYELHLALNEKLSLIAAYEPTKPRQLNPGVSGSRAIIAAGVVSAHTVEVMQRLGLWDSLPLYQVRQPYPLHTGFMQEIRNRYEEVLVLEETAGVIEMQLADYRRVKGRLSGFVPNAGELTPDITATLVGQFTGQDVVTEKSVPAKGGGRRPTLCPGCPHRAAFYAIKKAAPQGIYPSDIGCYTLGINLGGVDTVLCMGASIGQAAGFYHAHRISGTRRDIVATIGDSTFFHAGIPPLVNAISQGARFVLVILDNRTTAMTGNQPTPAHGSSLGKPVLIEDLVTASGVEFCRIADPLELPRFTGLLKEAVQYSREQGMAVVIARSPCLVDKSQRPTLRPQAVVDATCTGCQVCTRHFECPALVYDEQRRVVTVDTMICSGCGVCLDVCPSRSIGQVEVTP